MPHRVLRLGDPLNGPQGVRKKRSGSRTARTVKKGGMKRKDGRRREKQRRERIFIGDMREARAAAQRDT